MKKIQIVKIADYFNPLKVHTFKFYRDYHVTYNQEIKGKPFYRKWERVNMRFGYSEYLLAAKVIRNHINLNYR